MSFGIFNYRSEDDELKDMFSKLTADNYAITDSDYETVQEYTLKLKYPVKLRRLKSGKVKVRRNDK